MVTQRRSVATAKKVAKVCFINLLYEMRMLGFYLMPLSAYHYLLFKDSYFMTPQPGQKEEGLSKCRKVQRHIKQCECGLISHWGQD